jgi:hypothetical protein
VLDDWWQYDMDLKLFSRELNQRTPTPIGTASFGKYFQPHVLLVEGFFSWPEMFGAFYISDT